MSLLSKIFRGLTRSDPGVSTVPGPAVTPWQFFAGVDSTGGDGTAGQPYVQSAWVMAAVKFVVEPIAGVPLRFAEDTAGGRSQKLVNDPVLAAFWSQPATGALGAMNFTDFVDAVAQSLLLKGRAPIFMEDDWLLSGRPEGKSKLQLLNPDRLRPLKGRDPATGDEILVGWAYRRSDGAERLLDPENVSYVRLPHPYDPFGGASPMLAAQVAADADVLGAKQGKAAARNNGQLAPVISTRSGVVLQQVQVDQIKAALAANRGKAAAGKAEPLFLPGDVVVNAPTLEGLTPDFIAAREMNREEIFAAFGVPASKAKPKASYSIGSASDEYHLIWNTCFPLAARIAGHFEGLSCRLLNRPRSKPLFAWFDFTQHPVVQAVRQERLIDAQKLCSLGVPFRTADLLLDIGAPRFAGDDVGFLPLAIQRMDEALTGAPPARDDTAKAVLRAEVTIAAPDPFDALAGLLRAPLALPAPTPRAEPVPDAEERRRAKLWKVHAARRRPAEKMFESKITKCLSVVRGEVLANLDKLGKRSAPGGVQRDDRTTAPASQFGDATTVMFDPASFEDALVSALAKVQRSTFDTAGREVFDDIGKPDSAWQMPMGEAINALRDRENLIRNSGQEIFDEIKNELETGFTAGETTAELADRVRGKFNEISKGRATTIAVTETGAAYGAGQAAAQTQAGVKKKQWLSARDKRVRPDHRAADGQIVPIDELFTVGGERTPYPCGPGLSAKQACFCRCISLSVAPTSAVPTLTPPEEARALQQAIVAEGRAVKAAMKAHGAAVAEMSALAGQALAKPGSVTVDALREVAGRAMAAADAADAADAVATNRARELLTLPASEQNALTVSLTSDLSPEGTALAAEAVETFRRLMRADALPEADLTFAPAPAGETRPSYDAEHHAVRLQPGAIAPESLHEMGHWLENTRPDLLQKSLDFLDYRRGSEPLQLLNDLIPGRNFDPNEFAWEDDFTNPYTGKNYTWKGVRYSTEILSTGLERLWHDTVAFAMDDPEFFAHVIESLRTPRPTP